MSVIACISNHTVLSPPLVDTKRILQLYRTDIKLHRHTCIDAAPCQQRLMQETLPR